MLTNFATFAARVCIYAISTCIYAISQDCGLSLVTEPKNVDLVLNCVVLIFNFFHVFALSLVCQFWRYKVKVAHECEDLFPFSVLPGLFIILIM